jgi:hypothetical protein
MAIGFPSTGSKGKRIGECWAGEASADGTHEILIRPDLDDTLGGNLRDHEIFRGPRGRQPPGQRRLRASARKRDGWLMLLTFY